MSNTPLPPTLQPLNMEAQADSVQARMRHTQHDEQLHEAERATREGKAAHSPAAMPSLATAPSRRGGAGACKER